MTVEPDDPRLTAYALGELAESDGMAIEEALASSPELRQTVDGIRRAAESLVRHFQAEPAQTLTDEQLVVIAAHSELAHRPPAAPREKARGPRGPNSPEVPRAWLGSRHVPWRRLALRLLAAASVLLAAGIVGYSLAVSLKSRLPAVEPGTASGQSDGVGSSSGWLVARDQPDAEPIEPGRPDSKTSDEEDFVATAAVVTDTDDQASVVSRVNTGMAGKDQPTDGESLPPGVGATDGGSEDDRVVIFEPEPRETPGGSGDEPEPGMAASADVEATVVPMTPAAEPDLASLAAPDRLVLAALGAEVAGQRACRVALLQDVLARWPDHPAANWHSGRVRDGVEWRSVKEVEKSRAQDEVLREYQDRRRECAPTAIAHLELANWCQRQGLSDEERIHLMTVVQLQPTHLVALRRLGVREYRGQWLPTDEIERRKEAFREAERAERHWRPILAQWRRLIEEGTADERREALRQLKAVTDPQAFPVMELVFSEHSKELGQEVVHLLGRLSQQEATESLVRHAVFSRFEDVRESACNELQKRPLYNFVPMLLAAMAPPLEVTVEYPSGTPDVVHQKVLARGPEYDLVWVHTRIHQHFTFRIPIGGQARGPLVTLDQPRSLPQRPKVKTYHETNTPKTRLNDRIRHVLQQTTGHSLADPEQWWSWWTDYNEYETPDRKPVVALQSAHQTYSYRVTIGTSCLASGTPIWTQTGAVPVEMIRVGDKVLAQDVDSGELAYKLVLRTTIRRLGAMRRITIGEESITTTLGHPFWVTGAGWHMAKQLEVGHRVWCLDGSREISSIEELPEDAAFNLVVEDFNTYFVGNQRVLLHDNSLPQPTAAAVPGMALP